MMQFLLKNPGSGQTSRGVLQVKHKNGSWCILEAMAKSNLFKEPFFQSIVVNFRDVTGRKRAERANIPAGHHRGIFRGCHLFRNSGWGYPQLESWGPKDLWIRSGRARGENLTLFIYPDQMVKPTKYLNLPGRKSGNQHCFGPPEKKGAGNPSFDDPVSD